MNPHDRTEELLKRSGTTGDMDVLLAIGDLSPEERRGIEIHRTLAGALSSVESENISVELRQSLYEIEMKPRFNRINVSIPAVKEFVPYLVLGAATLLVIIFPPFSKNEILRISSAIAAVSAYIFYELLKSKFFVGR